MRIAAFLVLVAVVSAEERAPVLPDEEKAVVITLDDRGGFGPRLPPEPWLEVLVDGTLKSYGKTIGALTKDELAALVRFVVVEQRFFEWDRAKAEAKMEDRGVMVLDASDTRIKVVLKDRKHEAKVHALGWLAQQHPKVEALQRLARVQRRLQVVRHVAVAGGAEKAATLLGLANRVLAKDHPAVPALAMDDLHHATVEDGVLSCRFHRPGEGAAYVSAYVKVPKDGEPVVEVMVADTE